MKLKEIIDEILSSEYDKFEFNVVKSTHKDFTIGDDSYVFIAQLYEIGSGNVLSVEFKLKGGKQGGIAIEGGKKSFLVFSKIANYVQSICKDISPTYINFQARESKRQKIYNKLFNYIREKYNFPYEILKNNPITNDEIDESDFWLKRIK